MIQFSAASRTLSFIPLKLLALILPHPPPLELHRDLHSSLPFLPGLDPIITVTLAKEPQFSCISLRLAYLEKPRPWPNLSFYPNSSRGRENTEHFACTTSTTTAIPCTLSQLTASALEGTFTNYPEILLHACHSPR